MKQRTTESRAIVEIFNVMGEIVGELLPEFDDAPDLFGIDFDFA
jgi:hypothetical protein